MLQVDARSLGRIKILMSLYAVCAVLALSALVLDDHDMFVRLKPIPMIIGLWVSWGARNLDPAARYLLVTAMAGSLAGDVFLLGEGWFIHGLVAFLIAHVAYVFLFSRDCGWLPSRLGALIIAGLAASIYAFEYPSLPSDLRVPVAVYVTVISLMTAQAIGRAGVIKTPGARMAALGALTFMASDTILSLNRFYTALPGGHIWVMSTYYAGQGLILMGMTLGPRATDFNQE